MTEDGNRWFLTHPRPKGVARLFCFPFAGGSAALFMGWSAVLGDSIEVRAVELPGHGSRIGEPPRSDLAALADDIAGAIQPLLDRPAFFLGHSLGAVIAFEVVRRLRHPSIRHLFASACSAPVHLPTPQVRALSALDGAAFAEGVRGYGGLPEEILEDEELRAIFIPLIKADFTMIQRYAYRRAPPLGIPIMLLHAPDDVHVPTDLLAAWQDETVHPVLRHRFEGGHFFIVDQPDRVAGVVGNAIRRDLAEPAGSPLQDRDGR